MLGSSAPGKRGDRSLTRGFTLIEVIIVIVIVGILMAVALPGYQDSMRKGRRADAKAGLMDAANRQERFMLDRSAYSKDMEDLGFGDDPSISEEGHYSIDVDEAATLDLCNYAFDPNDNAPPCYVLMATPVSGGAQADDARCAKFTVNSSGAKEAKTAEGSVNEECW